MDLAAWSALEWLALIEYELLLFAGVFFLLGAIDEIAVDLIWLWRRVTGRGHTHTVTRSDMRHRRLSGAVAVFIPTWQEREVIDRTLAHARSAWAQDNVTFYIGCYRNDPASLQSALEGAGGDRRVRMVVHDRYGPSTKADCLNRLYRAMEQDELRRGTAYRTVLLHDAEDMVDPAALGLIDRAIDDCEFVQLPVLPLPHPASPWVGSHYCEEFAESHGKGMVVRDALGAALPAAGVGCAFRRDLLDTMARGGNPSTSRNSEGPFSGLSLTEDYELGLAIGAAGGRSRFLRVRGDDGQLVATRSYFPSTLAQAVRQKARWVHGIAFQGWDRLGWNGTLVEKWMRLRDRRGPLAAVVLLTGYTLFALALVLTGLDLAGYERPWEPTPLLLTLLALNMAAFVWRAAMRFAFTAREYGAMEGLRAVLRIPLSNVIAIMAGRRAMFAYARTLRGGDPEWEKTAHDRHPAPQVSLRPAIERAA
ncbi:glycosyl transferase family protein [Erythrobacter alti]|uniref:glycosyl transferase family protein n=1 Tax=Erythrobacter alti TaxID=1896145 RepID=UPI0030F378FA